MASLTSKELTGRYNVREFGLQTGSSDGRSSINRAIIQANIDGGGTVVMPADLGTIYVSGPIQLRSNVHLVIDCTVSLMTDRNSNIIESYNAAEALTNVRLLGYGVLDGNRSNQDEDQSGVPLGLASAITGGMLENISDLWVETLTFKSCLADGLAIVGCTRVHVNAVTATDNGRHGVLVNSSTGVTVAEPHSYDNSKVETAGTGDGVHFDNASTDNAVIGPRCYDTLANPNKRQGYGVREAASSSCNRNVITGGALNGNRTGTHSLIGAASLYTDALVATTGTPEAEAINSSGALGSSTFAAPLDHVHGMPAAGTPVNQAIGDSAAAGNATTFARSNHVHGMPDSAVTSNQAIGDTAAEGVAVTVALSDHKHGMPAAAAPALVLGTAAVEGDATTLVRSNATIVAFDTTDPTTQASGDFAAVGAAAVAARRDHKHAMPEALLPSLWGTGADGAIANLTDADSNATTIAQSGTLSATSNRTFRATGNISVSQDITIGKQNGQARGSFPTTHGSPGIELGAILAALGSKGIPSPIRPGGDNTSLVGGIVQLLSGATVDIGAAITAQGANAASDGGGGGGLVVVLAKTSITGAGAIDVSAAAGHATAAARGGAGSYSGAPGGHAGIGGSGGGGSGGYQGAITAGAAGGLGAGFIAGKAGAAGYDGAAALGGGGGGGSLDNTAAAPTNANGADGAAGGGILSYYAPKGTVLGYSGAVRATVASSGNGGAGANAGGNGGTNGGGGGGGGAGSGAGTAAGVGGAATALGGSGGGGAGASGGGDPSANGGAGASGSADLYVLSSPSVYAGLPGGMGGGGGGGATNGNATPTGTGGAGGAGAAGIAAFVASMGNGAGGAGANGTAGQDGNGGKAGGAGGAGGNGGGAAGLVLLIAPSITYNGTVTGRLVTITGAAALNFIRGFAVV